MAPQEDSRTIKFAERLVIFNGVVYDDDNNNNT